VEVRIGIIQAPKELDIELASEVTQEEILAKIEAAFAATDGVVWLTDKRGRQVGVPAARIAYVEIGTQDEARKVGFGTS
jgi:hypothetical protein